MPLDGDTAQRIMYDIAGRRSIADSKLTYDGPMKEFRSEVEAEWEAWQKDHPDAELYVPPELPPVDGPRTKVREGWAFDDTGSTSNSAPFREGVEPRKDGLPRKAFAYTPTDNPSDWKLPYLNEDASPDAAHLAAAAAAISPGGFRGQKADIPADAVRSVKAKLRAAYRRLGKGEDEMPDSIREVQRATPDYVIDLIAEEQMQPRYVIEVLMAEREAEALLGEGSDDHYYGAWTGGSAKAGGHPTGGGKPRTKGQRDVEKAIGAGADTKEYWANKQAEDRLADYRAHAAMKQRGYEQRQAKHGRTIFGDERTNFGPVAPGFMSTFKSTGGPKRAVGNIVTVDKNGIPTSLSIAQGATIPLVKVGATKAQFAFDVTAGQFIERSPYWDLSHSAGLRTSGTGHKVVFLAVGPNVPEGIREMFREASGDDHFYGAWSGGSKAAGGHPAGSGGSKGGGKAPAKGVKVKPGSTTRADAQSMAKAADANKLRLMASSSDGAQAQYGIGEMLKRAGAKDPFPHLDDKDEPIKLLKRADVEHLAIHAQRADYRKIARAELEYRDAVARGAAHKIELSGKGGVAAQPFSGGTKLPTSAGPVRKVTVMASTEEDALRQAFKQPLVAGMTYPVITSAKRPGAMNGEKPGTHTRYTVTVRDAYPKGG